MHVLKINLRMHMFLLINYIDITKIGKVSAVFYKSMQ